MTKRTILIFPIFDNMEIINKIREKYDPLANLIAPHITLVFPFESELADEELFKILEKRLSQFRPFEVEFQGFSKNISRNGNYLFLNIIKGQNTISEIHDILYENEFNEYYSDIPYLPHITVGKFKNEELLELAFRDANQYNKLFLCQINKISIEMIGSNEESIIVKERYLDTN
ncbi:Uncharacterised protein [Streptococcus porcinus]|uniref:2'-5' RNA ligase n=1 Tax=Streptococcus porcinus TaxID=1340 RepID=A0A4V0GXX7_STRPO|nr:2'-5' RNA ligase family protein [Streptococcus porcinus]VTT41451.1 Uncharacterised protein [Streptococcus porcinus]